MRFGGITPISKVGSCLAGLVQTTGSKTDSELGELLKGGLLRQRGPQPISIRGSCLIDGCQNYGPRNGFRSRRETRPTLLRFRRLQIWSHFEGEASPKQRSPRPLSDLMAHIGRNSDQAFEEKHGGDNSLGATSDLNVRKRGNQDVRSRELERTSFSDGPWPDLNYLTQRTRSYLSPHVGSSVAEVAADGITLPMCHAFLLSRCDILTLTAIADEDTER